MKNAKVGIIGILFLISDQVTTPQKGITHNKNYPNPICASVNNINI